jgi:hypothetical protein
VTTQGFVSLAAAAVSADFGKAAAQSAQVQLDLLAAQSKLAAHSATGLARSGTLTTSVVEELVDMVVRSLDFTGFADLLAQFLGGLVGLAVETAKALGLVSAHFADLGAQILQLRNNVFSRWAFATTTATTTVSFVQFTHGLAHLTTDASALGVGGVRQLGTEVSLQCAAGVGKFGVGTSERSSVVQRAVDAAERATDVGHIGTVAQISFTDQPTSKLGSFGGITLATNVDVVSTNASAGRVDDISVVQKVHVAVILAFDLSRLDQNLLRFALSFGRSRERGQTQDKDQGNGKTLHLSSKQVLLLL